MSYNTFEINNGELTINTPDTKLGVALAAENKLKDVDVYLDADNWGESDTPILDELSDSFGDMW